MTVVEPKDAIERVRERGDIIKWDESGHTVIIRRPDDAGEIISRFAVEWHSYGEVYPQPRISPMSLLNVLASRDFCVLSKSEIRR